MMGWGTAPCPKQSPVRDGWPFVFAALSPTAVLARVLPPMQAAGAAGNMSPFTNMPSLMIFDSHVKKKEGFSDISGV